MNLFTDWRTVLRHWSTLLIGLAIATLSLAMAAPEIILHYWGLVPDALKSLVPHAWLPKVSYGLMILAALAKFINQAEVKAQLARLMAWLRTLSNGGDRGQ